MEQEKKLLLVYHKEDNDGVFSAALIVNYFLNLSDGTKFTMEE